MNMRGISTMLLVLAIALSLTVPVLAEEKGTGAPESTSPPKHLKKMADGHWTAWEPPAPPAGANVHTVVKGETFWGLAAQYLKNPYLWPQIWDQNRYVNDSHWIYPGDPIVVPAPEVVPTEGKSQTKIEESKTAEVGQGAAQEEAGSQQAVAPAPEPVTYKNGSGRDLHCAIHVRDQIPETTPTVVSAEEAEMVMGMGQGNVVFLSAGMNAGWKPGDTMSVVRDTGSLKHPATGKVMGHRVDDVGTVKLIAVQPESSTAEIVFSCEDIRRGDRVIPYTEIPMTTRATPLVRKYDRYNPEPSGKPAGYLVAARDPQVALAQGNVVAVDIGEPEGVKAGDILSIFRENPEGPKFPRINLGEAVVLSTEGPSAVARIYASGREIYVGDRIEVR